MTINDEGDLKRHDRNNGHLMTTAQARPGFLQRREEKKTPCRPLGEIPTRKTNKYHGRLLVSGDDESVLVYRTILCCSPG